jgi:hypothetical protein
LGKTFLYCVSIICCGLFVSSFSADSKIVFIQFSAPGKKLDTLNLSLEECLSEFFPNSKIEAFSDSTADWFIEDTVDLKSCKNIAEIRNAGYIFYGSMNFFRNRTVLNCNLFIAQPGKILSTSHEIETTSNNIITEITVHKTANLLKKGTMASLIVKSNPVGSQVFLDGLKLEKTPTEGFFKAGPHILQVRKSGYYEEIKRIELLPMNQSIHEFNLKKIIKRNIFQKWFSKEPSLITFVTATTFTGLFYLLKNEAMENYKSLVSTNPSDYDRAFLYVKIFETGQFACGGIAVTFGISTCYGYLTDKGETGL